MSKLKFHIAVKSILVICTVICMANNGQSQNDKALTEPVHSPRKATIYAIVLPGLWHVYNKKYWKLPIVYGAIGGCLTAAIINNNEYTASKDELLFRKHNSRNLNSDYNNYTDAQLLELTNYSRKWRDNMIIFTSVAYMLSVVDANVDAHLFNFNVDENLALNVMPYTYYSRDINAPVAGLSFKLSFR